MSASSAVDAVGGPPAVETEPPLQLDVGPDAAAGRADSASLFDMFVENESDVRGLLAYALHKQHERDWLTAFEAGRGRPPTEADMQAFAMGERLPRRASDYRRLAEDMLRAERAVGRGAAHVPAPDPADGAGGARPRAAAMMRSGQGLQPQHISWRQIGFLLLLVVAMAIVFRLLGAWLFR